MTPSLPTAHTFTAIDFETAHGKMWSICQVGLVRVENGQIVKELDFLVRPPQNEYHWGNSRVHRIYAKDTLSAPSFKDIWHHIAPYIDQQHVVAHNASFDCNCLNATLDYYHLPHPSFHRHCTVNIYKHNLAFLCAQYGIPLQHHNALSDARACAQLFQMYLRSQSELLPVVKAS